MYATHSEDSFLGTLDYSILETSTLEDNLFHDESMCEEEGNTLLNHSLAFVDEDETSFHDLTNTADFDISSITSEQVKAALKIKAESKSEEERNRKQCVRR